MKEKLLIVAGGSDFLASHLTKKTVVAKDTQAEIKDIVFICNLAENNIPRTLTWFRKNELLAGKYLSEIKNLPLIELRLAVLMPPEKDLYPAFKTASKRVKTYTGSNQQQQIFGYVKDLAVLATGCL